MRTGILLGMVVLWCGLLALDHATPADARSRWSKKKEEKEEVKEPELTQKDSIDLARRHLSFGARYLRSKQYEDAEIQLTKSLNFNPQSGKTAYYMGKLRYELENQDEAVTWFRKAVELAPESKNTRLAHGYLAQIYLLQENREEAAKTYETLLTFSPTPEQEILYLHSLVSLYVEMEEIEKAQEYARRWAALEPDNADVQDTVAKLALYTGDEDEALQKMEELIQMNPEDFDTLGRLADMYRRQGSTQKALSAYQKLHGNDPGNYLYLEYLLNLGRTLRKSTNYQKQILRKMLALQGDNLSVLEQLADMTGDMRLVNRGLKLDPRNGKLLYMKGTHYYDSWKKSGSKQDSTRALSWFGKARNDPQWSGFAKRMIDEINPPLTKEEKAIQKFFKKKDASEEVDIKGKK